MKKTTIWIKKLTAFVLCISVFISTAGIVDVYAQGDSATNIIAAWEGGNPEEYTWSNANWTTAVCEYKAESGTAAVKFPSKTNPSAFFKLANPVTQSEKITKMIVSMKTNQDVYLKLYYVTGTKLSGFKEAMSASLLSFEKGDGDFKEYEFPVNADTFAGFTDNMQSFRVTVSQASTSPSVDFAKGLEVEFKYIRFVEETLPDEPNVPDEPVEEWPVAQPEEVGFEGRNIIYGIEMNDNSIFNDWGQGISKYPPDIVDGIAKFEITDKSNMSYGKETAINVPRNKAVKVAMKLRSTAEITPQLYFSGTDEKIDSTRMLTLPIVKASEEFKVVSVDTSTNENWTAVPDLTRYRLSFSGANAGDVVEVDWVRLYSDVMPAYTQDSKCISYDFESSNYGFECTGATSDVVVYNGELWSKVTGDEDGFSANNIQYNADDIVRVDISYKNDTAGTIGKLYFTTEEFEEYCEECCYTFEILPNEDGVYKIHTSDNVNWQGKITGLRFIPSNQSGDVIIDYIRLNKLQCSVTSQNGEVNVTGDLYGDSAKEVILSVRKAQGSQVVYTDKVVTNEKGKFTFKFEIPDAPSEPSVYNAFFQSDEFDGEYKVQFLYATKQYVDGVIEDINEAKANQDFQEFKQLVEDNYAFLNTQSSFYEEFVSEGLHIDEMYTAALINGQVSTSEELGKKLDDAVVSTRIKYMTGEEWYTAIDKYEEYLKFNLHSEYKIYEKADEKIKKEIVGKIGTHTDYASARKAFDEQTVLVSLQYAVASGDVKNILENISEENADIDFEAANRLKNPDGAYRLLTEGTYTSFEEVKAAFDNAIKTQSAKENVVSNGGGSVGGGGGGGGASANGKDNIKTYSSIAPVISTTDTNQDNKTTPFYDMNGFGWANEAVNKLYNRKIISGTSEGFFEPSRKVTREEFVKMLVVQFEVPFSDEVYFTDTVQGSWYIPYIGAALKNGFVNGQGNAFGIGQALTRQDAAVMVSRILGYENVENKTNFIDDNNISDYAKSAVFCLGKEGILNGYDNGSFAPMNCLTRAEAAVILNNILEKKGEADEK